MFSSAQELKVYLHKHNLSRSHTKKSKGIKSHDLWLISPRRAITRPENISCNNAIFARIVWHVVPCYWSQIFSKSYSSIASKKCRLSYRHRDIHQTVYLQARELVKVQSVLCEDAVRLKIFVTKFWTNNCLMIVTVYANGITLEYVRYSGSKYLL